MTEIRQVSRSGVPLSGLVDALDRVIGKGAAVAGDVVIALDGIDLIRLDLRLLLTGVEGEPVREGGSR